MDAIAAGKPRILLTLATGTGKTFIAFQIVWRLFQSRWNLSGEPTRRPRILFLLSTSKLGTSQERTTLDARPAKVCDFIRQPTAPIHHRPSWPIRFNGLISFYSAHQ